MRQNETMAEPQGPRSNRPGARRPSDATGSSGVAAEAATSTMKGIVLILVAIAIGIVLLNVVDDGDDAPASSGDDKKTTTTTEPDDGGPTSTEAPATLTPHNEIKIQVLNGRGVQGAAGAMTDQLKGKGYTDAADPADADGREGDVVACVAGLEREAVELATLVGNAEVLPAFPEPAPANAAEGVECLVILGSPKATA
jgi:LytR cell envelope-related transcriptional attenuator